MLIAFRADASLDIGTGHVMRCLTLAKEFVRRGDECIFICREHQGNLIAYLLEEGVDVLSLPLPVVEKKSHPFSSLSHSAWLGVSWQQDAEETLNQIGSRKIDCLVVDHYALDISWEQALCKCVGNIFVIDDLADREHDCFALLDQNYGREPIDYNGLLPQDCFKLIGPKYALLRPEFLELRASSLQNRRGFKLETILINLGGVDQSDFTSKIIDMLSSTKLDAAVNLIVVLGTTNPNQLKVRQLASASPYNIKVRVGVNNMAELMSESDLAIGAAGSTTWERFALAVPSLLLSIADNQDSALTALAASGCIYKLSINTLQKDLVVFFDRVDMASQLSALSKKGRDVCDALGVSHVEKIIRRECER